MILELSPLTLFIGCGLMAASVALATWTVLHVLTGSRSQLSAGDTFEQKRLPKLRETQPTFRWFEPLVRELAGLYDPKSEKLIKLQRHLKLSQESAPWTPAEFLATKNIEAVLCAVVIYLLISVTGFRIFAAMLALMMLFGYTQLAQSSVVSRSQRYMKRLRLRLPFAVDQIALMMQAGAEFEGCLETVVRDNVDHPLIIELREVLRQVNLGRPRGQALTEFRDKLCDNDISELVFAINKGEELGTPISSILREQADQMRLKRSQWAEQAAGEAEVQMVFPGMIVMVACMLVVVAPILLPALVTFLE